MALDFFAGCIGGCAGVVVGHPLDTIKVRLQTQDFKNPLYRGTIHCFRSTLEKEGVRGLYKGMSSPMAGVAAVNAILFGVYGNMQRRMPDPESLSAHFMAGAAAGFTQSVVASPMELAKTRVQIQDTGSSTLQKYRSPLHCIREVYRTEGFRGVFRGQLITILREVPGFGSYFMSYEILSRYLAGPNKEQLSTPALLFAGGMAGCLSWLVSYPADVIKSRIQADASNKYTGIVDCFTKSLREDGFKFLTRGLSSTMLRSFPTNAATFASVTWVLRLAGVEDAANADAYISASEFNDDMLRIAIGTPAALPSSAFLARRKARIDRDALSANGEDGDEAARGGSRHHPRISLHYGYILTMKFRDVRDVESATFDLL